MCSAVAESGDPAFATGVAIVTGGSGGIGSAICTELAGAGSNVVLTYRSNRQGAEAVAARIRKMGRIADVARLEIEDADQVRRLADETVAKHGSIHSAIYASGPPLPMKFIGKVTPPEWAYTFNVDVNGCFNLVWSVLPHFRTNGAGSFVAVTTSAVGRVPPRDILSAAPKAAIEMLLRGIAKEEGRFGIRANCVGPGWIDAGLGREAMTHELTPAVVEANKRGTPMRRFGKAEEVAMAAVFLASSKASFITGQSLAVDGGLQL
jgi:NAD(P)-dependent dehydrogenase (short-subunit alcohol dehydrogenase family)